MGPPASGDRDDRGRLAAVGRGAGRPRTAGGLRPVVGREPGQDQGLAQAEQERIRAEKAFDAEKQARDQAEQERARLEEAFQRTRSALDFFTDESDKAMAGAPELQGLRRTLLAAALDYYSDFSDLVDGDPSLRSQFETSQTKAAELMAKIGTPQQSADALEQVRQIQQKMLSSQPQSPIWQIELASVYHGLSDLRGGRELEALSNQSVQEHLSLTKDQIGRVTRWAEQRLADQRLLPFDRFACARAALVGRRRRSRSRCRPTSGKPCSIGW